MIHETAVISPDVTLGQGVQVGPYTVIDDDVAIGDNCRIGPHVHISGHTTIGAGTKIHAGAVVGDEPQDFHYKGAETFTRIGANCIIREYATVHRATDPGTSTVVGDGVMLMAMVHVAHNCELGEGVVIANASILGGHVKVARNAFLSANLLVHQFCRIGTRAMIHGGEIVTQDIPPYCMVANGGVHGVNTVGLKRAGFAPDAREAVRKAIKTLYFAGLNRPAALEQIAGDYSDVPEVCALVDFVRESSRGIVKGSR